MDNLNKSGLLQILIDATESIATYEQTYACIAILDSACNRLRLPYPSELLELFTEWFGPPNAQNNEGWWNTDEVARNERILALLFMQEILTSEYV